MRLFDEHVKRKTHFLDGMWDVVLDKNKVGEKEKWFENFPQESFQTPVPGCLNNRMGLMDFDSVAWYKKEFYAKGAIVIKFHAVTGYAKVYLDGEFLGDHYGGFASFEVEAFASEGMHTLVVMVNAESTEDTIPLYAVDWQHYCGIIRSVEVSEFESAAIKNARVEYTLSDDLKNADLKIYLTLKNYSDGEVLEKLKIDVDGTVICDETVTVIGSKNVCVEARLENIRLWDIHKGELYTVTVQTEKDDLIDRIGFRKIEARDKKILLNGKPIKIMGVNRHEEHPDWGFAMPPVLNAKDIDILKNLNANAVRGSHYPNSKFFIDMCDAEGILFWSEIPMWGYEKESLVRPIVIQRGLDMHSEMVAQYYNHPSIIIWGMHNEIASETEEGFAITEKYVKHVKSLDDTRLVTYTTNRILKDVCLPLVDLISVNHYIGWYYDELEDWQGFVQEMKKYLVEKNVGDKPVVFSEFGVGAIYGNKNFEVLKWSEDYQEKYYKHTLGIFLNDAEISGVYLWQYADMRSNPEWNITRVRGYNNKGILNEYRHPKLAYYAVKELFGKAGGADEREV